MKTTGIPKAALLFLTTISLAIIFSGCGKDSSFPGFTIKPLWKGGFRNNFAKTVCSKEQMFTSCFALDVVECEEAVSKDLFSECYEEFSGEIPFFVNLPEEGRAWGQKLGGCIGGKFYEKFAKLAITSEQCDKATERTMGKKPNMNPLEAFFSDNPSARLLHATLSEQKPIFDGIEKAIKEKSQNDFSKFYTKLLRLEGLTIAKSGDAEIIAYYQNHVARRKLVQEMSAPLCHKVFVVQTVLGPDDLQKLKSSEQWMKLREQSKELSARAVASALEKPKSDEDVAQSEALMDKALAVLPESIRAKISSGELTEEDSCASSIAMMEAFIALPENEAAQVLRLLHKSRLGV